ncbi:MAG: hypothetical protein JSW50_11345 [Candidatus Latescibacterota bacterium]|nr:MAG: hypothetical protein JSW50_11345 [Candidatus Latescibacterota bacterium]
MQWLRNPSFLVKSLIMVAVLVVVGYVFLSVERAGAIKAVCVNAQADFDGCQIDALISYLNADTTSLAEKNRTIWVLGELRDDRAIPALLALSGSETCDHGQYVCQYEIHKALKKIRGEALNPFFWQRYGS